MLKDDYLVRSTDALATTIAHLVLRKQGTEYTPSGLEADAEADGLWFALDQLIKQNKFNEAEDLLYEKTDLEDLRYLEIALDFYVHLNNFSDQDLEAGGFQREEIGEGLRDMARQFGVELPM